MPDIPQSEASQKKVLSGRLKENRDRIIAEWMDGISSDDQIAQADRLTLAALRDHFPEMLDELIAAVGDEKDAAKNEGVRKTGREHGKARWRNGYRLNELLREIGRLRETILREMNSMCRGEISDQLRDEARETIRLFFDTISATSAQQFVESQEAEVVLRSSQLAHAYEQVQAVTEEMRAVAASRASLLRAVTHELRNALNPVMLAAQVLLEDGSRANGEESGKRLSRVARRLQSLLDRLHGLSELLAGEARACPAEIDLDHLRRELDDEYRPVAEKKGVRFQSRLAGDLTKGVSDPAKLHDIAANLLSNAIRYTDTGSIHLEMITAEEHRWVLKVTDSGRGISPEDAQHLFSDFHPGNIQEPGSLRLGLVLTRYLARLLGGEVTFQPIPGGGSSFEVNLPLVLSVKG